MDCAGRSTAEGQAGLALRPEAPTAFQVTAPADPTRLRDSVTAQVNVLFLALAVVVGVALAQKWTAVLQPWAVLPAPALGGLIGLLSGLYPAARAAWIEPITALRR